MYECPFAVVGIVIFKSTIIVSLILKPVLVVI